MIEDCLLTVGEVAERLKVQPSWVYSNADRLGAFHLGKYLRFKWSRVIDCLEKGQASLSSSVAKTPLNPALKSAVKDAGRDSVLEEN
jgi:hypothetical protein